MHIIRDVVGLVAAFIGAGCVLAGFWKLFGGGS
jgi:hypothetical protein